MPFLPNIVSTDLESLIESAQRGDSAAINTLCVELYPRVQRLVHRSLATDVRRKRPWLGAMFSTGDVVQEVFISITRDLEDFRGKGDTELLHYIATLTRNRLIDAIRFYEASRRDRRRDKAGVNAVEEVDRDGESPPARVINLEQIARFHRSLSTFSARDRTLLRERIEHRRPFEDLATTLGFASADSTRKAFYVAQAKLLLRLRSRRP